MADPDRARELENLRRRRRRVDRQGPETSPSVDDERADEVPPEDVADDVPEEETVARAEATPEAPPPRKRGPAGVSVWIWVALAAVVMFAGGFVLVNYLVMPRAVGSGQHIVVPNVVGLPVEEAEMTLQQAGLRSTRAGEAPSAEIPAGAVAAADPPPGMEVKRGRLIELTVSAGPELVRVPAVESMPLRRARILLESVGLAPGRISYAYSDWVARGLVINTSPPADSGTAPGAVVDLRVSLGPPPTASVMPDVHGFRIDGVEQLLKDQGYRVIVQGRRPAGEEGDLVVVDQYPPPGSQLAPGDSILLVGGR